MREIVVVLLPNKHQRAFTCGTLCVCGSLAGKRLAAFVLKKSLARLVRLGWTDQEELVAILDDGHAHLYTVFGELIREVRARARAQAVCDRVGRRTKAARQVGLGADCQNAGIADCQIFPLGFVVMTNKYEFIWFASFVEPKVGGARLRLCARFGRRALSSRVCWPTPASRARPSRGRSSSRVTRSPTPSRSAVTAKRSRLLRIVARARCSNAVVQVLVATSTGTILVVDGESAQDQLLENGPFECISVAPGGWV